MLFGKIAKEIVIFNRNMKWKKINRDDSTTVNSIFPLESVKVGKYTYGKLNFIWMTNFANVKIGNYCSIAPEVKFLVGGEHDYRRVSTFPFQTLVYNEKSKEKIDRDIIIEDDVWIGYDCLILSGAHIGQGSVIGARSVVTGYIPPYSVYVGNKLIKKRFPDVIIKKLSKIDYHNIEHKHNDKYKEYCQVKINEDNIDEILRIFCDKS